MVEDAEWKGQMESEEKERATKRGWRVEVMVAEKKLGQGESGRKAKAGQEKGKRWRNDRRWRLCGSADGRTGLLSSVSGIGLDRFIPHVES